MALEELQKDSGKRLPSSLFWGSGQRNELMKTGKQDGWGVTYVPTNDLTGKTIPKSSVYSMRKSKTLSKGTEHSFTRMLNKELLGGDSYPVLEAALGTAVGAVSGGAGLLFSAACLGLSLSKTTYYVLAREGDELWQVEQIGKVGKEVIHISSYFLYDPYRTRGFTGANGWLIHEERETLKI